jgi:large subunit ribosomal protein L4
MRSFEVKVNRKARRKAFRGVLSHHASNGTLAILDASEFDAPSTRKAAELVASWGERPTLVVVAEDEELVVKSFRNLEKVLVTVPAELEVASLVWARSVLITEAAMPLVLGRAGVAAEEEEAGE